MPDFAALAPDPLWTKRRSLRLRVRSARLATEVCGDAKPAYRHPSIWAHWLTLIEVAAPAVESAPRTQGTTAPADTIPRSNGRPCQGTRPRRPSAIPSRGAP